MMSSAWVPDGLNAADDRPHEPTADPWWGEWWRFDFAGDVDHLAGLVRVCLLPNQATAWYWASLDGVDRRPVVVHDDEVALRRHDSLEIRGEGLWADHIIEVPFEQMTVGCEAFALRLDDPAAIDDDPVVGERIPFGLDLEWETTKRAGTVGETARDTSEVWQGIDPSPARYELACEVHGDVLVADERIEIETRGLRSHGWGVVARSSKPRWSG